MLINCFLLQVIKMLWTSHREFFLKIFLETFSWAKILSLCASLGVFSYGTDVNGATWIKLRVNALMKFSEWTNLFKKFLVFMIEKEYSKFLKNQNNGICLVFDCKGAGIGNVDIDLLLCDLYKWKLDNCKIW